MNISCTNFVTNENSFEREALQLKQHASCELSMPRTHEANKSNLFAQIFNPYEGTLFEFAQINDGLLAHVYKALVRLGSII